MTELIRKRQAAELLGVSAPRISQLLTAGHLSEVADTGMLSKTEVEQFALCRDGLVPRTIHSGARINAGQPERSQPELAQVDPASQACEAKLPPIAVSRQRLEALRAEIAQHDLDARHQKLVSREDVARTAFEEGRRIREALQGLPFRIAHELAAALGLDAVEAGFIVQEVIADEIRQILITLTRPAGETEEQTAAAEAPRPF